MHRKQTHDHILKVVPPLFLCVVIDIHLDFIWYVLDRDHSCSLVFSCDYSDLLISLHMLDNNRFLIARQHIDKGHIRTVSFHVTVL